MAYSAGGLFGAGSGTVCSYPTRAVHIRMARNAPFQTASGITVMIMAAACHRDAQARVQEELDEVIGRDRGISTL